ncbi:MFS transporter [Pelagibacterium sp. H642]|uniref:MFS transporter n=1 Tax=Pelagibacterium sp. H642 TaxID=1881069 RepID=UPI002814DEDA|nr:MFS transporter [Pelagibacterium sp. H642]WMT92225.1 MFS transporter [Pelagibacterium sp. H642]
MTATISGWSAIVSPRYLGATVTLCLGVALLAFNGFLVSTALPTAVAELGGVALLSWATTVFLVFAIMGGAGAALLKERLGARMALIAAASVFLLGSLIAAIAGSMPELLVGRALQGLGEGIVAAICYALIPELFPSSLVPKVFGAESVVWALAAFGGPVLSGGLTETLSWRAAFAVNLPIGAIFIALVLLIVPRGIRSKAEGRLPIVRLLLIGAAIMAVSVGGLLDSPVLTGLCLALAAATLWSVIVRDRTAATPLFPTHAFRLDDVVGAGLWVILLMPLAQAGSAVFLVYALQNIFAFGPTLAGMVGAVMAITWSIVAILVAGVSDATRPRLIRIGPMLLVAGLGLLAVALAMGQLPLVILSQVLIGASYGASWAYTSQTIMEAARPGERDRASALLPTIQSAGYGIGAAVAGLIANSAGIAAASTPEALTGVLVMTFALCAGLSLPAVWAALAMTRR